MIDHTFSHGRLKATIASVAKWSNSKKFATAYSATGQAYAKAQTAYAFALAETYRNTGSYISAFASAEDAYISALCSHFNTGFDLSEAYSAARDAIAAAKPSP